VTGFKLRSDITEVEVIAVGRAIRMLRVLTKLHGKGRWRKLKGRALVELPNGRVYRAELHWYEAHGLGRHGMKVKRLIE
jgi:hypothetical protein